MQELLRDPVNAWLMAGAGLIAFEAFTAPGLGIFLVGLGGVCTALLIRAGIVGQDSVAAQFAWCFFVTIAWTFLLWKPLRTFRLHRKSHVRELKSNNLIGETATVLMTGLKPGETGYVAWSGTTLTAELDPSEKGSIGEGAKVIIRSVTGNVVTVTRKQE